MESLSLHLCVFLLSDLCDEIQPDRDQDRPELNARLNLRHCSMSCDFTEKCARLS